MKLQHLLPIALLFAFSFTACDSGPRVIEMTTTEESPSESGISALNDLPSFAKAAKANNATTHEVVVEEILATKKYSYLKVKENGAPFWVAISKQDIETGATYLYKGGLLKRNFFSREFNRVFETVYLVSKIWKKKEDTVASAHTAANAHAKEHAPNLEVGKIKLSKGAVALSDVFSNKAKYSGQTITITGKCVKVNPMIMNRNWLHIQDGSGDGLDLTVTTTETVPLGAVVSLQGTIALDKDFGAGYRYDIIMEGAVVN